MYSYKEEWTNERRNRTHEVKIVLHFFSYLFMYSAISLLIDSFIYIERSDMNWKIGVCKRRYER